MSRLTNELKDLKRRGLTLNTIFDIGAHKGAWSNEIKRIYPESYYHLFEANPDHARHLADYPHLCGTALSDGREYVDFYKRNGTGDSYYKERTNWYNDVETMRLPAITLDEYVHTNKLPQPQMLKLDTQGSELDILKGAVNTLRGVELIATECPVFSYNEGTPDMGQYIKAFWDHGFLPYKNIEDHYIDSILVQIDILFIRKEAKEAYVGATSNLHV